MGRSRLLEGLVLLLPLLLLPVLLFSLSRGGDEGRFEYPTAPDRIEKLVITSPQWEGIKVEFEDGFKRWMWERQGVGLDIEWLDHGGGTKTLRWIEEQFGRNPEGIGVDILFGGGTDPYEALKESDLLESYVPPPDVLEGVAREIGGFPIIDEESFWFGTALTGFGIMHNEAVLELIPELRDVRVETWSDLEDPRLFGWVGAADPRASSSYHQFFEIVLQGSGFEAGMRTVRLFGGNVRNYSRFSSEIPKLCAVGQVAVAPTIDQYAFAQIEKVGDVIRFVLPAGRTLVNADAAGILKGAPNRELAERFIDFLLSEEAARLWMLRRGEPGGPTRHALTRACVRPEMFEELEGRTNVRANPFAMEFGFRYDYSKAAQRWTLLNDFLGAVIIDTHQELSAAVRAYHRADEELRPRAAEILFANPFTEEEMLREIAPRWDEPTYRERKRIEWADFARQRYLEVAALLESEGRGS